MNAMRGRSTVCPAAQDSHKRAWREGRYHSVLDVFMKRSSINCLVCAVSLSCCGLVLIGCRSPAEYRERPMRWPMRSSRTSQQEALGKTEPLRIERPSDILRRRLIEAQGLPVSSEASLGTDQLKPIPHWPEEDYPRAISSPDANIPIEPNQPLQDLADRCPPDRGPQQPGLPDPARKTCFVSR